ncbi:MAG: ABC transporter permease [Verrucomicrobiales bacterium]
MAWRDSRSSRKRLLLFSSSIVIGIAALVAINSFGHSLRANIDEQSKALLGADLVFSSREAFTDEATEFFESIPGENSREIILSSMVLFPKSGSTRLVQVRAIEPGFPYYGAMESSPTNAAAALAAGRGALLEESLLIQFNAQPGDTIKVGELELPISGSLQKVPGENTMFTTIAPRVYVPMERAQQTQLLRSDSFAQYRIYFKLPDMVDPSVLLKEAKPMLDRLKIGSETVAERKAKLGRAMENVDHFLSLGGYIALILGAIGVASAIHVHIRQKVPAVAMLRCLGCTIAQTFAIYLLQAVALGLIGAITGAALGLLIQYSFPALLSGFVPFEITLAFSWGPVLKAMAIGFSVCIVFALLPLVTLRKFSPLAVLRGAAEESAPVRDPLHVLLYIVIVLGLVWFARTQTNQWRYALGFSGAIIVSFLTLAIASRIVMWFARRLALPAFPYLFRQGLANLYRPNNRTFLLTLSLGLGTFLVLSLYLTNQNLMRNLFPVKKSEQANAALFDIQTDQRDGVKKVLQDQGLPVLQDVPIVTMRLASIKEETTAEMLRQKDREIPRWILRREYRSTYRDELDPTEITVAGQWPAKTVPAEGRVPISIEEGIAKDMKAGLGDYLEFDVQGVPMECEIVHIRTVDWKQVKPNFFMVFPSSALEDAPAFHVITTRVNSRAESGAMQRNVVTAFPNVSVIDLTLVLDTIDSVLNKVAYVVRFMALFTVGTGLLVLVAAIMTGKYQRIRESILLRTLGGSRKQVMRIQLIEYMLLGLLGSTVGILLAQASSWALAKYLFKIDFHFGILPSLIAIISVSTLTILTGFLATRGALNRPPLEVLRQAG